jgi:GcrA cell cycle regulator
MAWTDERVELLKKLWAEGLSASQIANRLGGVTRNAVIGKVHRLGLSGRTTTSRAKAPRTRRRPAHTQTRAARPQLRTHGSAALKAEFHLDAEEEFELAPSPIKELVIPLNERATILTLTETKCRWPIGDPCEEDFHFCGRYCDVGVSYCEYHSQVAYQPANSRRRDSRAISR